MSQNDSKDIDVTFHNVTLTIRARNAKEAYADLCRILRLESRIEFDTHRYSTEDETGHTRPTKELWGDID